MPEYEECRCGIKLRGGIWDIYGLKRRKGQIERLLSESERLLGKVNDYSIIERLLMGKSGEIERMGFISEHFLLFQKC